MSFRLSLLESPNSSCSVRTPRSTGRGRLRSEIWDPSCFSHFKGNAWGRIYTTNGFPTRFWFQNQEIHFQWKLFTGQLYAPHHSNGMRNLPTFEFWGVSAKYLPVTTYPIQIFDSNIWFLHCSNQIALLQGFCVVLIFHNISTPNKCCKDIVPTILLVIVQPFPVTL